MRTRANAELVLHQLAHRAHAPVAKVIDVVHRADVLAQLQRSSGSSRRNRPDQRALLETGRILVSNSLMLNFKRPTREKSYLRGSKTCPGTSAVAVSSVGRIAWTQLAVNLDQRFLRRLHRITLQRLANDRAHVVALREEHVDFNHARGVENLG